MSNTTQRECFGSIEDPLAGIGPTRNDLSNNRICLLHAVRRVIGGQVLKDQPWFHCCTPWSGLLYFGGENKSLAGCHPILSNLVCTSSLISSESVFFVSSGGLVRTLLGSSSERALFFFFLCALRFAMTTRGHRWPRSGNRFFVFRQRWCQATERDQQEYFETDTCRGAYGTNAQTAPAHASEPTCPQKLHDLKVSSQPQRANRVHCKTMQS